MGLRMLVIPMTLALSLFLFFEYNYHQYTWITNNDPQPSSNHAIPQNMRPLKDKDLTSMNLPDKEGIEEVTVHNVTPTNGRILMYNRVPKCGSGTMRLLLHRLGIQNGFVSNNVNIGGHDHKHKKTDQLKIIRKLITYSQKTPVTWSIHAFFFEEARDYNGTVAWMNIIRDPIEKFVSHFYFRKNKTLRHERKNSIKAIHIKNLSLEECIATGNQLCTFEQQLNYFCGNDKDCSEIGNRWALKKAMEHAEKYYIVVGINEERQLMYALLEAYMPTFFRGFSQVLHDEAEVSKHVSPPGSKKPVSNATRALLKDNLKEDYEFYEFMRQRFHMQAQTAGLI